MNTILRSRRLGLSIGVAALLVIALSVALALPIAAAGLPVFINELHYDNAGGDVNEGVEIAGPAGTDLTGWSIELYNGNTGASYGTINLSGSIPDQQNGFGTVWFAHAGIQNGAPDGLALVNGGTVVQFLSYEGSFTATDGPANGMTSTDIGVMEPSNTPVGESLQLVGVGRVYEDFAWSGPTSSTYDAVNTGQVFLGPSFDISKSAPGMVSPNEVFTYTIVVTNSTGVTTTGTVITDVVPTNADFASASDGGVLVGDTVSWTISGNFVDSDVVTRTFQVTATSSSGINIVNEDYGVRATDWITMSAGSPITTAVSPLDLTVTKTGPEYAVIGENIVYTILLQNQGIVSATNVILTDTLPISTTYVSDDSGIVPTVPVSGVYVWDFSDVPSNTLHTFNLTVTVDSGAPVMAGTLGLPLVNRVEASTDTSGDNPDNNSDTAMVTAYPLVSIHDIQYVADPASDDASPYEDDVVWVEGVVVAGTGEIGTESNYFVIEHPDGGPWSGLLVYNGGTFPDVVEGDYVRLLGEVSEYYDMTEIEIRYAPHVQQVISTGNTLPATEVITTALFATAVPTTAEAYESVLIEFQEATVTDEDLGHSEWEIDDSSGPTRVDDYGDRDGNLTYTPLLDDRYGFIRGIGWYSYDDYKLEPRYDADINQYPRVLSVGPADGATGVAVSANVTATFNLTMTNVDTTTFLLEGPSGDVDGAVTFDDATKTATFNPSADLALDTTYTATLVAELAATNGLTRGKDYVWSFATGMPGLAIIKTVEPGTDVPLGGVVAYTITLVNNGDAEATGVVMTDALPPEITFGGWIEQGSALLPGGDTITWGPWPVAGGGSYTIRFTATVTTSTAYCGAAVTNTVEFDSANAGSGFSNDAVFTIEGVQRIYLPLVTRNYSQ